MNLALEYFADNPVIDELVCWPPRAQKIRRLRACSVLFRQPFIELELQDGELIHYHFARADFAQHCAEAFVILDAITEIELVSEFELPAVTAAVELVERVLAARDECIEEATQMYAEGMYEQFLMQFGADCKNLPAATEQHIASARRELERKG